MLYKEVIYIYPLLLHCSSSVNLIGDAEMEQKMNRVIRACIELGDDNPICSIHDQGAGGNGNVLKEISEPAGASFYIDKYISFLADMQIEIYRLLYT